MARGLAVTLLGLALLVAGCGGEDTGSGGEPGPLVAEDPGAVHVHGLGVNPADGALFVATHTGLFRAAPGEQTAERVADQYQDTMGFTIVGPDRFLGSGHPDLRTDQPPYLGLIRSTDAGASWTPVSLYGKADFHVLEAQGSRVVGYGSDFETRAEQLLVSGDGGKSWAKRRAPAPLIDIALSPEDPDVWVAAGRRLVRTDDGGRSWTPLGAPGGLLAWGEKDGLYRVDGGGAVTRSADGGRSWRAAGDVAGAPAALEADGRDLYVALHSGVIKRSTDGGKTWTVRSRPKATTSQGG